MIHNSKHLTAHNSGETSETDCVRVIWVSISSIPRTAVFLIRVELSRFVWHCTEIIGGPCQEAAVTMASPWDRKVSTRSLKKRKCIVWDKLRWKKPPRLLSGLTVNNKREGTSCISSLLKHFEKQHRGFLLRRETKRAFVARCCMFHCLLMCMCLNCFKINSLFNIVACFLLIL